MPFQIIRDDIGNVKADYIADTGGYECVGGEYDALKRCYENSLKYAVKSGCKSIALPLVPEGKSGYSEDEAVKAVVTTVRDFLLENDMEIILVVDKKPFTLSGDMYSDIEEYIDERYVSEQVDEEVCYEAESSYTDEPIYNEAPSFKEELKQTHSFAQKLNIFHKFSKEKAGKGSIKETSAADTLMDRVSHLGDTWQETLLKQIDDRGYTDTEVYKRANVDRKLFSKIRSNSEYQPKKITAVAFALALKLNLDETKDFIGRAGYAFSPSSKFDLIIEYFIEHDIYDPYTINLALFEHNQPLLGA